MNVVRVLKNGSRYYSSFVGGRQHVYSFLRDEPLRNCADFIAEYKKYHKRYPPADTFSRKLYTKQENEDSIRVDLENIHVLQRRCLMYNVGLIEVDKFEYTFKKGLFDVSMSVHDTLPDISLQERKNLLNYALILNDPSGDHSE
jgi:hypothetical protein